MSRGGGLEIQEICCLEGDIMERSKNVRMQLRKCTLRKKSMWIWLQQLVWDHSALWSLIFYCQISSATYRWRGSTFYQDGSVKLNRILRVSFFIQLNTHFCPLAEVLAFRRRLCVPVISSSCEEEISFVSIVQVLTNCKTQNRQGISRNLNDLWSFHTCGTRCTVSGEDM